MPEHRKIGSHLPTQTPTPAPTSTMSSSTATSSPNVSSPTRDRITTTSSPMSWWLAKVRRSHTQPMQAPMATMSSAGRGWSLVPRRSATTTTSLPSSGAPRNQACCPSPSPWLRATPVRTIRRCASSKNLSPWHPPSPNTTLLTPSMSAMAWMSNSPTSPTLRAATSPATFGKAAAAHHLPAPSSSKMSPHPVRSHTASTTTAAATTRKNS